MDELPAHTLAEFSQAITDIRASWDPHAHEDGRYINPWFRGHANGEEYHLLPSLYRPGRGARGVDTVLRELFRSRALPFITDDIEVPRNDIEWYLTMQHYGVPTRLLDWTEGALIALFFAIREPDQQPARQAAVWMLDPYAMNDAVGTGGTGLVIADTHPLMASYVPSPGGKEPASGSREDGIPEPPLAIHASRTNRRISAQRGTFTLHGSDRQPLEAHAALDSCLAKVVIPAGQVEGVRMELAVAGIRESTVFPDLSGLATELEPYSRAPERRGGDS